jgi:hypothetical protein
MQRRFGHSGGINQEARRPVAGISGKLRIALALTTSTFSSAISKLWVVKAIRETKPGLRAG